MKLFFSIVIWIIFWSLFVLLLPFLIIFAIILPFKYVKNRLVWMFCNIMMISVLIFPKRIFTEKNYPFPVIYTANHVSFFDLFISGATLPGFPRGFELLAHFKTPIYGWFITFFGEIPMDTSSRKALINSLDTASKILQRKERNFFIMPEGTRTRTGQLGQFKSGAFYLSMKSGVPIVPVVYKNLFKRNNANNLFINPGKIDIIIGKPFYPDNFETVDAMCETVKKWMDEKLNG